MSKEQITALQESIAHWERLRDGIGDDLPYSDDCACCQLDMSFDDLECTHCPIYEFTGEHECRGTPYIWALNAFEIRLNDTSGNFFHEKAQDEINFLKEVMLWVEAGKPEREA